MSIFHFLLAHSNYDWDCICKTWMNNQWNRTLNNQYTLLIVTSADCHEYFQPKIVFGEHIEQINTEISIE